MAKLLTPEKAIWGLEEFSISPFQHLTPRLYVIAKPDRDPGANSYLKQIMKLSEKYGAAVEVIEAPGMVEAAMAIIRLKTEYGCNGILLLSSYGKKEDTALAGMIPSRLDIDCMSSHAYGLFLMDSSPIGYRAAPCTAIACYKLLEYEHYPLDHAKVAVIGRSFRVGRPAAAILTAKNATVTLYHSRSNLETVKDADIVIAAIGKPKELKADLFSPGQVVIDVGINADGKGKLCGDVDTDNVATVLEENGMITPVPGCVGPLTNAVLFAKLFLNAAMVKGEYHHAAV